jgi:formylglycine-generating enzyme required for sulfatase activity
MFRTPLALLKALGKAVLNAVGGGFIGELAVDIVPSVARDVWNWWAGHRNEEQRREDLEALANAPAADVRAAAEQVVAQVAADQPPEVQLALITYLTQVPAAVRQSLRRPSDPTGHNVPIHLSLASPDDVVPLLPVRLPRFKPGDRPLPGNDWELVELLGTGGFGEVWKARNPHFDGVPPVALKFCLDDTSRDRLLRHEAAVLNQVMRQGRRPGIVALLHTYLSNDPPCLEYEYIEGGDLAALMVEWQDRYPAKERFERIARVMLTLARILGHPHRLDPPIVHRDMKPANILVRLDDKGEPEFHVTDFGIGGIQAGQMISLTRLGTSAAQFQASAVRGAHTPLYASPQQMHGGAPDVRDDVHALGVIWFQFLTGNLTHGRPGGSKWIERLVSAGVPRPLLDLLSSCVEEDPDERPADAQALAEQLARLIDKPAIAAQPKPKPKPKPEPVPEAVPEPVSEHDRELPRKVSVRGIDFVLIPAGTFSMGSPVDEEDRHADEGPQRRVTISQPFYLATTPVTQRQYEAITGKNPARFHRKEGGSPDHPVEQVSWADAIAFCKKLPAHAPGLPGAWTFRLPTEAEWEYACRAGTTATFWCGADLDLKTACHDARAGSAPLHTARVGTHTPSPWGLFDMHGNVWEWCIDWYDEGEYALAPATDPTGPTHGTKRVVRGGSWNNTAAQCRSARRYAYPPTFTNDNLGFRVVLALA